jgi:predicted secreted protein
MTRGVRVLLIGAGVVCVACVVWVALGAGRAVKPTPPGAVIDVKAGGRFRLAIESNASTGYTWVPLIEGEPFEVVKDEFKQGSSALGAPGVQVFELRALKSGTYSLKFSYVRPWEGQPERQAEYTVRVK